MTLATQLLYAALLLGICGYAAWRGGGPERLGAAIFVAGSVLSGLAAGGFEATERGIIAIDMVALAVLLAIALKSDRFWPLWATAFHLLATVTHVATAVAPEVVPRAYAVAQGFWAYPMLVALLLGTWREVVLRRDEAATPGVAHA